MELGNDLVSTFSLHSTEKFFVITIKDIKTEKIANSFSFELLKVKLFNDDFQPRITGYHKENDLIRFFVEKDPDDVLFNEIDTYQEYENMKINEKLCLCIKLVDFLHKFEKSISRNKYFNSFLYLTSDNIVFNLRTRTFKLLFYPFEISLINAGIPNSQIKTLRTPFLPIESLKLKASELNPSKLNSYIVGCILINFLTKKIPWVENDSDIIKESILKKENLAKIEVTKHFLKESLLNDDITEDIYENKSNQILKILEFCCDPELELRKNLNEILVVTKALIPNFDSIACENCIHEVKEISTMYCSENNKLICPICVRTEIHKCKNEKGDNHISITSFENEINNHRHDIVDLSEKKKEDNFEYIYSDIKKKLDYNQNQVKYYENNYIELKNLIIGLNEYNENMKTKFIATAGQEEKFLRKIEEKFRLIEELKLKEISKFDKDLEKIGLDSSEYENSYQLIKKHKYELEKLEGNFKKVQKNVITASSNLYKNYDDKIRTENSLMIVESAKIKKLTENVGEIIQKASSDIILPDNITKLASNLQELELKEESNFDKFNENLENKIGKILNSIEITSQFQNQEVPITPY